MTNLQLRRTVQTVSFVVLHGYIYAWSWLQWLQAKGLCLPVLSCHTCALAWTACPIGVLMHFTDWRVFPLVGLGLLMFLGALAGRLFCGWVCPFGSLQALLYRIPTPKIELPDWTAYVKYAVLALMVFLLPYLLGSLTYFSFCRICPAAALQVVMPGWIANGVSVNGWLGASRMAFLALVLVLAVVSSRSFCKVFCPIGALIAPLNYISFWRVSARLEACVSCQLCDAACSTGVRPSQRILRGVNPNRHQDCIVCHSCEDPCPAGSGNRRGPARVQVGESPRTS